MRRSLWQKRIPTLLGVLLLGGGLFLASYVANSGKLFITTNASPAYTPENIRITNLTDTSFTLSYTTSEAVVGSLTYKKGRDSNKVALDDRDQATGEPHPYLTHHITVKNLEPQQPYSFTITSKDKTFLDGEEPFTVTTLTPLTTTPTKQQPIVGTITLPTSSSSEDVLVFLVSDNAQVLSVLPKQNGTYVLPLNAIRTNTLDSYLTFQPSSVISMLITNGTLKSTIKVLTSQINPVPPITLGQNYDFTATTEPLAPTKAASESAVESKFPSFSATEQSTENKQPQILTPENKESFKDTQPSFDGLALPGEDVQIEIHSDQEIVTTVQAGNDGRWTYRPDAALEPGEHTITIKTRNKEGILQTLTRSFTVYAAGSQFIEPSVSPTEPTPTPTMQPTPTPTIEPTATPTPIIVEVTITPPPPEESPGSSLFVISGILASLIIGVGSLLFITSRKGTL